MLTVVATRTHEETVLKLFAFCNFYNIMYEDIMREWKSKNLRNVAACRILVERINKYGLRLEEPIKDIVES